MTELDLLAADLGVSGRTLRRAAARGALRLHRPTPRTVELSAAERRYLRTHWHLLDAVTEALRTQRSVRLAVLFGSVARGDDGAASDVDLLIGTAQGAPGLPLARVGALLEELLGRPVQVVAAADAAAEPALLAEIARDGRVLVDRDGTWARIASGAAEAPAGSPAAPDAAAPTDPWQLLEELAG